MTTVADKLAQIYDTKSKIRDAVNIKGGTLLENTPFTEYPEAILELPVALPGTAGHKWEKNPTWWDIKSIIENDNTEGYRAIYILLEYALGEQTSFTLGGSWDAVRTSDGAFYTQSAIHVWDTTKDKECNANYKTRYVIYYVKSDSTWLHGDYFYNIGGNNKAFQYNPQVLLGIVFNVSTCFGTVASEQCAITTSSSYQYFNIIFKNDTTPTPNLQFIDITKDYKLYVTMSDRSNGNRQYYDALFCYATSLPVLHSLLEMPLKEVDPTFEGFRADAPLSNLYPLAGERTLMVTHRN